ncbi:hypothetical protein TWF718_004690 [Orbilia javanica]|uniref:Uncharacterized protein n=1 Tax=Orbilia javanica TaxID=47235 RepID=A0AAN8N362_9PEZI
MTSRHQQEENLLLDLYEPPQEVKESGELLLIDLNEVVVRPDINGQASQNAFSKKSAEAATATGFKTPTNPARQTSSSACWESSDNTSNNAASSLTSVPVETASVAVTEVLDPSLWDLHRHLAGLEAKESRYRELNKKAPGGPGELTPKFVTDLINHAEGSLCFHGGAFTKQEQYWLKCAKCKAYQSDYSFECKACNTILCRRCRLEVQDREARG